jgi:hypothetical protein
MYNCIMSKFTVVDGRGNIHKFESEQVVASEHSPDLQETPNTMSIEEYRKIEFTPEQEWNNTFNPKRVSIDLKRKVKVLERRFITLDVSHPVRIMTQIITIYIYGRQDI